MDWEESLLYAEKILESNGQNIDSYAVMHSMRYAMQCARRMLAHNDNSNNEDFKTLFKALAQSIISAKHDNAYHCLNNKRRSVHSIGIDALHLVLEFASADSVLNCRLVSKDFRNLTQKHVWREIHVSGIDLMNNIFQLDLLRVHKSIDIHTQHLKSVEVLVEKLIVSVDLIERLDRADIIFPCLKHVEVRFDYARREDIDQRVFWLTHLISEHHSRIVSFSLVIDDSVLKKVINVLVKHMDGVFSSLKAFQVKIVDTRDLPWMDDELVEAVDFENITPSQSSVQQLVDAMPTTLHELKISAECPMVIPIWKFKFPWLKKLELSGVTLFADSFRQLCQEKTYLTHLLLEPAEMCGMLSLEDICAASFSTKLESLQLGLNSPAPTHQSFLSKLTHLEFDHYVDNIMETSDYLSALCRAGPTIRNLKIHLFGSLLWSSKDRFLRYIIFEAMPDLQFLEKIVIHHPFSAFPDNDTPLSLKEYEMKELLEKFPRLRCIVGCENRNEEVMSLDNQHHLMHFIENLEI